MIKYLFFILVFAVSCDLSSKVFSVCDEGFKKHRGHEFIEKKFSDIENRLSNTLVVSGDESNFVFMENLTGISSTIAWGDISYYESMKDYRNDRKKWEDWYLKNACTVEISYIDSVKVSLGLNY